MGKNNFDEVINRKETKSTKWDSGKIMLAEGITERFDEDTIPAFTADMDFACPPEIMAVKEKTPGHHVWKEENSWGVQAGMQGRYLMDDSYLEKYAFQFVIHKKYLSREMLAELGQEPIVLSDKDLMGI